MPKIRNVSGENLLDTPHGGRLVLAGAVIEVEADEVYGYTSSANWDAADPEATKVHESEEADYFERLRADGQAVPGDEVDPEPEPEKPAPKKSSKPNPTPEV